MGYSSIRTRQRELRVAELPGCVLEHISAMKYGYAMQNGHPIPSPVGLMVVGRRLRD
jgi:hypothetical protein